MNCLRGPHPRTLHRMHTSRYADSNVIKTIGFILHREIKGNANYVQMGLLPVRESPLPPQQATRYHIPPWTLTNTTAQSPHISLHCRIHFQSLTYTTFLEVYVTGDKAVTVRGIRLSYTTAGVSSGEQGVSGWVSVVGCEGGGWGLPARAHTNW